MTDDKTLAAERAAYLEQELADCYSLMSEANPLQVRRGGATRMLWLVGELCSVGAQPEDGQIEAVLQDVEDYKVKKFVEIYLAKVSR